MKQVKLTVAKILTLNATLTNLKSKESPLSWGITRSFPSTEKVKKDYQEDLGNLIKTFSEKDEKGNPKVIEGRQGNSLFDFVFNGKAKEASEEFTKLQLEEKEISYYEISAEKIKEYLATNPAPEEYEELIGTLINPELVD